MTFYVYSKIAADQIFHDWQKGGGELPVSKRAVTIKGGAGVMNKNFLTPSGIVTSVTDEEMEFLNQDHHFQQFKKNGFITVEKKNVDVDKVVANMTSEADPAAPLTPADYTGAGDKTAKPMGITKA